MRSYQHICRCQKSHLLLKSIYVQLVICEELSALCVSGKCMQRRDQLPIIQHMSLVFFCSSKEEDLNVRALSSGTNILGCLCSFGCIGHA